VEHTLLWQANPPEQSLSSQQLPPLFQTPEQHLPVADW
jgi:hypothetical protein